MVLNNLDFSVDEGDLVYIHGMNGSGKSTLFKIICDILKADEGKVIKDSHLNIGALIENPGFLENENLATNLRYLAELKHSYNKNYIIELCNKFNLDFYNKGPLKSYSIGMRQKVGIIQSIMENQNLILLDEPTRGLDEVSVKEFIDLINSMSNLGKSVVIASHEYLDDISFNKKYELKNGRLIEE